MDESKVFDNLLTDPISFGDLIGRGTTLQINSDYSNGISDEIYDEIYGSDNDDDEEDKVVSPWMGSFNELKAQMVKIEENIHKRILEPGNADKGSIQENSRVKIRYSSYWQGESAPFDSSVFSFITGEGNVLEGLERAVLTMYEGERAQFVISYKLLFGEMGCPPRIKKRADGLYEIQLISFNALDNDKNTDYKTPLEDRKKFINALKIAKELHLKGLNFFKQGIYKNAVDVFEKAGQALEFCQLANEEDEKEQTKFLIKLYTNLVVAYNKINRPNRTCIICRKIWQITDNKPSCKVIYQKGRALIMLGDYTRAKVILQRAQRMEPDNIEIKKELEDLEMRSKQLKESKEQIHKNVFCLDDSNDLPSNEDSHLSDFKENMFEILQDFKNNSDDKVNPIPPNLTEKEIQILDELAQSFDMKLTFSEPEKLYSINK